MRKRAISVTTFLMCSVLTAQQPDVLENNRAVARSFFEQVLDKGQLDHYPDSHAGNFVAHGDGHDYTLADDMAAAKEERAALPDM